MCRSVVSEQKKNLDFIDYIPLVFILLVSNEYFFLNFIAIIYLLYLKYNTTDNIYSNRNCKSGFSSYLYNLS